MRLLRSEEHLERWLGVNGWEPGASLSATTLNELARTWWWTRLDADWRPRPARESQALLEARGLVGEFWRLT